MPVDQQELFTALLADDDFAMTLKQSQLSLLIVVPGATLTVSADGVAAGEPVTRPTLRLELDSGTADELWAGRLPLMNAVVSRRLKLRGPVVRIRQLAGLLPAVTAKYGELAT